MKWDPVLPVCPGVVGPMRESLIHWVMLRLMVRMYHFLLSVTKFGLLVSSSWVLDRFILFLKRMGLVIKGREMELLSFLASLDSVRAKENHLVNDRGRVQEEGEVH